MRCAVAVRPWIAGAALLLAILSPVNAQTAPSASPPPAVSGEPLSVALTGRLEHSGALDLAALQALPAVIIDITRTTPQGAQTSSFTGAALWTLVTAAVPVHEAGPHSALRHTVLARGRDGYIVAFAIGELDPEFEGKQVLVAYAQYGKPLTELRLVVPGDKRAGRSVRDLVAIEVR
jgi:DMSO/TMAO reductase YedYZ molybdopterin-dependent catalytic subunit